LVPKVVTLNDFEMSNGRYFVIISPKAVNFGDNYVKLLKPDL